MTPSTAKVTVIDDYAHHPTEVSATIEAARLHYKKHRLIAVFRPHTYSRTRTLLREFQQAFGQADEVYITEVESARESRQEANVSGRDIVAGMSGNVTFQPDRDQLVKTLVANAKPGDVILCMSVSGYDKLAEELAGKLG
jgi:UDP-N-acetylmuramate--alanine ligase